MVNLPVKGLLTFTNFQRIENCWLPILCTLCLAGKEERTTKFYDESEKTCSRLTTVCRKISRKRFCHFWLFLNCIFNFHFSFINAISLSQNCSQHHSATQKVSKTQCFDCYFVRQFSRFHVKIIFYIQCLNLLSAVYSQVHAIKFFGTGYFYIIPSFYSNLENLCQHKPTESGV